MGHRPVSNIETETTGPREILDLDQIVGGEGLEAPVDRGSRETRRTAETVDDDGRVSGHIVRSSRGDPCQTDEEETGGRRRR
jgi:hypothetical protein